VLRIAESLHAKLTDAHAGFVERLAAPVGFEGFVRAAPGAPRELARRYLDALGEPGLDASLHVLTGPRLGDDAAAREVFLEHLRAAAGQRTEAFRKLAASRRQGVSELVLDVLLAGDDRDGPAWNLARAIRDDDAHPAQAVARSKISDVTGETERKAALAKLASGATQEERIAAWERLTALPETTASFIAAAPVIETRAFLGREAEEQVRALLALTRLDRERARVLLRKVLTKKSLTQRFESERLSQIAGETLRTLAREDRDRGIAEAEEGAP
jgi:hypothetical protein